jgi:hypothetical protein
VYPNDYFFSDLPTDAQLIAMEQIIRRYERYLEREKKASEEERIAFTQNAIPFVCRRDELRKKYYQAKRDASPTKRKTLAEEYNQSVKTLFLDFLEKLEIPNEFISRTDQAALKERIERVQREELQEATDPHCPMCRTRLFQDGGPELTYVCKCGYVKKVAELQLSYSDLECCSMEKPKSYQRVIRFQDVMNAVCGQPGCTMEGHHRDLLHDEIKRRRLHERPTLITVHVVKDMMKKLGLSKFYPHIPAFTASVNPEYEPPFFSELQRSQLRYLFLRAEQAYGSVRRKIVDGTLQDDRPLPGPRSSFLSHTLVGKKLCQLLGWDELASAFSLLKSEILLVEHDRWWRLICKELSWQYIPTIGNVCNTDDVELATPSFSTPWGSRVESMPSRRVTTHSRSKRSTPSTKAFSLRSSKRARSRNNSDE